MYEFGLPQKECGSAFFFVLIMQLCLLCHSKWLPFTPLPYSKGKKIECQRHTYLQVAVKHPHVGIWTTKKECGSAFFFVLIMQLRLFLFLCESQCCLTALLACWVACFFACLRKSFNFLMSSSCFTC